MPKEPLSARLYWRPHYYELARYVSYGGKRDEDVREKLAEMRSRFGDEKVAAAAAELTACDEATRLVLSPAARAACRQLLGPAPEDPDYADYYRANLREPPAEHQPPGPEAEAGPGPKRRGRGRGR